jgi:formate dehydrogenase maturation protein FdhE
MATKNLENCPMCGHATFNSVVKVYQYDNGEQFRASVCPPCAVVHQQLMEAK